jgi:hypothetical protein
MKGQISIEYLTVYGIAMVVVIGIISTFVFLNSNSSQRIPDECRFGPEIDCIDHQIIGEAGAERLLIKFSPTKKGLHDINFRCFHDGVEGAPLNLGIPYVAQNQEILLTPACNLPDNFQNNGKARLEVIIEYHLNLTKVPNIRTYEGTVIGSVNG